VSSVAFGGLRGLIHSWSWFFSCLVYGAGLAVSGALTQRFRPAAAPLVLKD
jgi:hypothetical protein